MRNMVLAVAGLAVLTGCAANGPAPGFQRTAENEQRLGTSLAGLAPQGKSSCVPGFQSREQRIIDENTILFSSGGRSTVYRSEIRNCPRLDRNSTIIRRSTSTQICSGEIFEVRDAGTQFSYGACTFGEFTRYGRTSP